MFHQISTYLQHRFSSNNRHGIHSPFVYEFVDKVLYTSMDQVAYEKLQRLITSYKKDKTGLKQSGFGAGSKRSLNTVSDVASVSSSPIKKASLLNRIVSFYEFENILELGTNLGVACYAMAIAKHNPRLHSIEGNEEFAKIAQGTMEQEQLNRVSIENASFESVLPDVLRNNKFDLVFVDGDHSYEATMKYFRSILPSLHNESMLILDDIYWSPEMTKAWREIQAFDEVKVSLDLYHLGILLFRKEMTPERFRIRF